mgnify:CR=1 FL=1
MSFTTSQGFYVWDQNQDLYSHNQLASNWELLDSILSAGSTKIQTVTSLPTNATQGSVVVTANPIGGFGEFLF